MILMSYRGCNITVNPSQIPSHQSPKTVAPTDMMYRSRIPPETQNPPTALIYDLYVPKVTLPIPDSSFCVSLPGVNYAEHNEIITFAYWHYVPVC